MSAKLKLQRCVLWRIQQLGRMVTCQWVHSINYRTSPTLGRYLLLRQPTQREGQQICLNSEDIAPECYQLLARSLLDSALKDSAVS